MLSVDADLDFRTEIVVVVVFEAPLSPAAEGGRQREERRPPRTDPPDGVVSPTAAVSGAYAPGSFAWILLLPPLLLLSVVIGT